MSGAFRQLLLLGHDIGEQAFVDLIIVVALLKADAEDIALLNRLRRIVRIDLNHVVAALALGLENLDRLGSVVRRDNTVRHLPREIRCSIRVAGIRQRRPVAVGAQAVRAARADVGACDRRQLVVGLHEIDLLFHVGQRLTQRRARGRHMLEGRRGRQAGRLFQRLDQLPRVERVAEIDIPRLAVQDLDRQLALGHENARRLLVGVAAVFQCQFFHSFPLISHACF